MSLFKHKTLNASEILVKYLSAYASKWVILSADVILVLLSYIFAYFVRFDFTFDFDTSKLFYQLPYIFLISLVSFLVVGSYKGIIRHTGTKDAFNVLTGTLLMSGITLAIVIAFRVLHVIPYYNIPISIVVIHCFASTFALVISRFIFKAFYEMVSNKIKRHVSVLIYGAGDSGLFTYQALKKDGKNNYDVIGFIDDDVSKIGKRINQVRIFAPQTITNRFIEKFSITEVIISIQNTTPDRLLNITDSLITKNVEVKIVPPFSKWIDGDLEASQIKEVKIEDLLQRSPINLINSTVENDVKNKTIFITGAAGSIGSEISRQLVKYSCKQIVLIDQAESPLYYIEQEFGFNNTCEIISIVADICDTTKMNEIFKTYRPYKVFHAAAYKHVPLMESNPYEAVKTNVGGTKIIANLAVKYNVERFVMISTDKAVNPTNIMGATKRIAELYISCLSKISETTKFTTTRFGNVLGSNGSVIPLFEKQLINGGPLTVTDKEITRFFMTIPEACSLVLEAGTMGNGGEIYIFDMGMPIKIYNIAKKMILLSGFRYPEDIDIEIIGLRPGEKLHEELFSEGEDTIPTYHEKIMISKVKKINFSKVKQQIEHLCDNNHCTNSTKVVLLMKTIVPEFISNNSIFTKLDTKVLK